MVVFSSLALLFTSFWNKGFLIDGNVLTFIGASVALAVVFYLIIPLSKIILLPLNIITLGLVSFLLYLFILHVAGTGFHFFTIKGWLFPGFTLLGITVHKAGIGYLLNLVLSSISISGIINVLEHII